MTPTVFIHFASSDIVFVDLAALKHDRLAGYAIPFDPSSLDAFAAWLVQLGVDLADLLPSPLASNTSVAPSWASVPDDLVAHCLLGHTPLSAAMRPLTPVRSALGEYWLVAEGVQVRVPALLCTEASGGCTTAAMAA